MKKYLKRTLLTTILMFTALSTKAFDAEIEGIYYNFSDISATVTNNGPNSYRGNLNIPEKVNYKGQTYTVTKIDEKAIYNSTALLSISLPESITEIGDNAFEGCTGLLSISIPGSVISLGTGVFKGCEYLETVSFNDGKELLQINEREWIFHVFNDCPVTTLYLGRNIRYNGSHSFVTSPRQMHYGLLWSDKLEALTIGKSVTEICYIAFAGCMNLKQIEIPSSIAFIDEGAFADCGITSLNIQNPLCQISDEAFWACTSLKTVHINSREIGSGAFDGCTNLEELTFGKDVSTIHDDAFMDCTNLKNVYSYAITPPSSSTFEFRYKVENNWNIDWKPYNQNVYLYVPKNSIDAYREVEPWKSFRAIFAIATSVESLRLSTHAISMHKQEEQTLSYVIEPHDADNQDVYWTSSDERIVKVDTKGNVRAINVGNAWVKAVSADNSEAKDSCKVTVAQPVTEIKLNITSKTLNVGESFDLVASVLPSDADNKNVVWSSDDDRIATVKNGKVTAVKSGVTRIYATSESDSDISAYCTVTVSQPVTEISLNISSKTLKVGESFNLVATVYPSDADNKKVVWSSENEEIATVNNGKVTAHKPGVTRIYATSEADINVSAYCTVTVTQPVTGISLSQSSYSFTNIGECVQLEAIVTPSDATNKEVKWSSSDETVCVVSNGKVVATGYGTAVVFATTVDGGYMATCAIIVENGTIPVTSVTISQTSATLVKGETLQLTATAHPDDATNRELIWKTSNEDVCVVTQKGLLIAIAEGKAVVTVVPANGVGQAQCDVEVIPETDGIISIVDNANGDNAIYDATGCRVSNVVKGHLYIRNGKKFIAK